jgi:hypothetical protein
MANDFHQAGGQFGATGEQSEDNAGWKQRAVEGAEQSFKDGVVVGVALVAEVICVARDKLWDLMKSSRSR